MNETGSLASGLLVVAVLVLLLLFIVRGGKFGRPSGGGGGSSGFKGFGRGLGRSRTARRSPFEMFLALFAIANLMTSHSITRLGAPLIVAAMVLLVISLAAFPDLGGLLAAIFGTVAAIANVALDDGTSLLFVVLAVTAFLAWIYYGVGGTVGGRGR
jgi:hypothetical protein